MIKVLEMLGIQGISPHNKDNVLQAHSQYQIKRNTETRQGCLHSIPVNIVFEQNNYGRQREEGTWVMEEEGKRWGRMRYGARQEREAQRTRSMNGNMQLWSVGYL